MLRRSFLRVMGAGTLAAKPLAQEAAAKLMEVDTTGLGGGVATDYGPSIDSSPAKASGMERLALDAMLRAGIFPPGLKEYILEDDYHVNALDPDLAAYRSFSMSAKVLMQKERYAKRRLESLRINVIRGEFSNKFREKFGMWL